MAPLGLGMFRILNVGKPPVAVCWVEEGAEHVKYSGLDNGLRVSLFGSRASMDWAGTLSVFHPNGSIRIGVMMSGSQKVPALPVMQHLFPSRFLMLAWASASGKGGS